jgi:hypothetical protein
MSVNTQGQIEGLQMAIAEAKLLASDSECEHEKLSFDLYITRLERLIEQVRTRG